MKAQDIHKNVEESRVTISQLMLPSHTNFSGKIHGGFILSLMDQIAFACASKHSRNYCVTASVDTVDFLNPVEVGEMIIMKASINYVGRSSMIVGIRVETENIRTGAKKHCNSSYFTMVAKDANSNNVAVPGLILDSEQEIRRFLKSARLVERKKSHKSDFKDNLFNAAKHIKELKKYNVIVPYEPARKKKKPKKHDSD